MNPASPHVPQTDSAAAAVLVVEDNDTTRDRIATLLRSRGYEVAEAIDGIEALRKVSRRKFDAIVLDLVLPNVDGWQFRATQLGHPEMASIPTVIVSVQPLRAPARYPYARPMWYRSPSRTPTCCRRLSAPARRDSRCGWRQTAMPQTVMPSRCSGPTAARLRASIMRRMPRRSAGARNGGHPSPRAQARDASCIAASTAPATAVQSTAVGARLVAPDHRRRRSAEATTSGPYQLIELCLSKSPSDLAARQSTETSHGVRAVGALSRVCIGGWRERGCRVGCDEAAGPKGQSCGDGVWLLRRHAIVAVV